MLDDVTSLDQLKWIFDGRKISQAELAENMRKSIEKWDIPENILEKWNLQELEKIKEFKKNLINIFVATE